LGLGDDDDDSMGCKGDISLRLLSTRLLDDDAVAAASLRLSI
jgi:hypothetical protein